MSVTPEPLQLREQIETITDQFTQPGTKYLRDLNDQLVTLFTSKLETATHEARLDELERATGYMPAGVHARNYVTKRKAQLHKADQDGLAK